MSSSQEELPLLAYVYHPRSFPTMLLVQASRGLCRLAWIVDTSSQEVDSMQRLLKKFGPVIDIAGLDHDESAAALSRVQPDGLLALADDNLRLAAELAARLGLPFHGLDTSVALTDKFVQRARFRDAGLRFPTNLLVRPSAVHEQLAQIKSFSFPAVFKPRIGEGSRDTEPVTTADEVIDLCAKYLHEGCGDREMVLEEFIADGPDGIAGVGFAGYVSVESYVCDGRVTHLAMTGRMPPAFPFRETGFFIPSDVNNELAAAVFDQATRAIEALGVLIGCTHTEVKITPLGPVVIEVNGRIGGGVPEMLQQVSGIDYVQIAMRLALGLHGELPSHISYAGVAFLFYAQAPVDIHTLDAVEGLGDLREVAGVHDIILNRSPGDLVDWRDGNHGHIFSVFGLVETTRDVLRVDEEMRRLVRIVGH